MFQLEMGVNSPESLPQAAEKHEPCWQDLTFDTILPLPATPTTIPYPDLAHLESPYRWSSTYKWTMTIVSCTSTLFASFAASCYSPGADQMAAEWQVSRVAILVGITTFTCGFAIGPMFLAPFSEIHGRKPVFIATATLFTICQICCAVTTSYPGMLVARLFCGIGGSTFSTMVGGIVADIFEAPQRNTPMALFSWAALFGTGLGPVVGGFISEYSTWRWIFYVQIIVAGLIVLTVIVFFHETRGPVILRKKARLLNRWHEKLQAQGEADNAIIAHIRWRIAGAAEQQVDIIGMMQTSVGRPFKMLFMEPVVFFFSLWAAFSWSILYINLSVIPLVFQNGYGFSLSTANAVFASSCIGTTVAFCLSIAQEHFASQQRPGWNSVPEHRIYFTCVESLFLPIGLFLFGWSAQFQVHWIVPAVAVGISTVGIFSIYLSVFNYLADTYHIYASSALAAQSFCRNLLGGIFPLVSQQMFDNLGFGPAASLLGAIGAVLTLVPWVLVWRGPRIRRRSKFARE